MFKLTEYFTLQEVLNLSTRAPQFPNQTNLEAYWFTHLIGDYNMRVNIDGLSSQFQDNTIIPLLNALMTIVYDRHSEDIVFIGEKIVLGLETPDYVLEDKDLKKVLTKLINIINLTAPKYIPLFTKYEEASVDPIAPIKSESKAKTRFNDTPQNIGEWDDEDHTSNISSSESETSVDVGTIMERLASMYKDYKSIILEWSNEFNQCFIKEEQIC